MCRQGAVMPKHVCHHHSTAGVDRRAFLKLGAGLGTMMATAREVDLSAQRAPVGTGSIDAHAHWVPQSYADALASLGRPTTSIHTPLELDTNLDQRIKWM